ncbi:MAG: potassium channel family protein [Nitrospiraceae bacterium]|nr:potassium channel family protein [Nitrospiraceae bacterium]
MNGHKQKKRRGGPQILAFWSEEHSLTALLILLIVEVFIVVPATRAGHALVMIGLIVFSFLLLAGLLAMARHRIFQVVSGVFVICSIAVRMARSVFGVPGLLPWDALLSMLSVVGMIIVVLWQVYREGPVTGHRVRGAVAAYLLIAILFAYSYTFIAYLVPGAFHLPAWAEAGSGRGETFFYFSMVALTTTGFGDITAIHPLARSLVTLENFIGQLYPAILIARLVTLEIETRRLGKGQTHHDKERE